MEAGVEEASVEEAGVEETSVEEVPPVCLLPRLPCLHRQHQGRQQSAGLEVRLYAPCFTVLTFNLTETVNFQTFSFFRQGRFSEREFSFLKHEFLCFLFHNRPPD